MGLFDLFGEIVPELKELGDEIQGIKDEFIASVMEPSGEFRDAVNGIASDLTGQADGVVSDATSAISDSTSIPISDGNEKS